MLWKWWLVWARAFKSASERCSATRVCSSGGSWHRIMFLTFLEEMDQLKLKVYKYDKYDKQLMD